MKIVPLVKVLREVGMPADKLQAMLDKGEAMSTKSLMASMAKAAEGPAKALALKGM